MRQGIRSRHVARAKLFSQVNPRLLFWCVFLGDPGDVQQHGFAPFLNRKVAETISIDARRTQELRGHTQGVQIVKILTEAKCYPDFFVADGGQIRRQGRIKVPPVVIRPALDGYLEQPIGDAFACATELRNTA